MELIQFRYSPYNEKVRWALDYKHVSHTRRSLLPGPHMGVVKRLTGRTCTPVLVDGDATLDGSARIIEWLERKHPVAALYPRDQAGRDEALRIETWFDDDLTPRARRAVLSALLASPGYFASVFGDGRSPLTRFAYACTVPLVKPLIRKGNGIAGPASVEDGMLALQQGLDFVAARGQGSGYLVGDHFSVADLAAAATLAVAIDPPDSPMARPRPHCASFARFVAHFAAHPGAQWVRDIYARHRLAGRDFEGRSPY